MLSRHSSSHQLNFPAYLHLITLLFGLVFGFSKTSPKSLVPRKGHILHNTTSTKTQLIKPNPGHLFFTMVYTTKITLLVAAAMQVTNNLVSAAVSSHSIDKRGTGVGELDPNTSSTLWNKKKGFGCGNNICYSPACTLGYVDSRGCQASYEIGGICDEEFIYAQIFKEFCGKDAWAKICHYTNDYIAVFVWNGIYQLSATTTKQTNLGADFNHDNGHSCKYGMLLSNDYHGSFNCEDLVNDYRSMLDTIPYDGCDK